MKTFYSIDNENFIYETFGEVLDALDNDWRLGVDAIYYEADFLPMEPQQVLTAARVLDEANERGYDLIGETWDNPFSVSRDAQFELQELLDTWAAKHVDLSVYYVISGDSRERAVTLDEVCEFHASH